MYFTRKQLTVIISIIILTPIILGLILNIPGGSLTIGDENSWVGFFGNYSGGIIGGIVAYLIANSQMKHEKNQRIQEQGKQDELNQKKILEKENYIKNIITLYLMDEIKFNLNTILKEVSFIEDVKLRSEKKTTLKRAWSPSLKFSEFEGVKFELIKYNNLEVREVIEFYKTCKLLSYKPKSDDLTIEDANSLLHLINKWSTKVNNP
ncbi:hypothetical protein [Lysinibacillus capsici]|uniref:hypothetical protein n=1 Tax=Lysinibacillus capsici TaxID=2115968 RepID=UPI003D72EA85